MRDRGTGCEPADLLSDIEIALKEATDRIAARKAGEYESSNIGMCTFDGEHWINPQRACSEETVEMFLGWLQKSRDRRNRVAGTWKPFTKRRGNMFGIKIQKMSTYNDLVNSLENYERTEVRYRGELKALSADAHNIGASNGELVNELAEAQDEIERLNLIINPLPLMRFSVITKDGQELNIDGDEMQAESKGQHAIMLKGKPVLILSHEPVACKISPKITKTK